MYCKICYKQFIRYTDNLPYPYDICNKCAKENITYTTVEISKEDQIKQCNDIIDLCRKNIDRLRKDIASEVQSMKYWCEELNKLTIDELEEETNE